MILLLAAAACGGALRPAPRASHATRAAHASRVSRASIGADAGTAPTSPWDALCDAAAERAARCRDDVLVPSEASLCKASQACFDPLVQPAIFDAIAACLPGPCDVTCSPRRLGPTVALDVEGQDLVTACKVREASCPSSQPCDDYASSGVSMLRGQRLRAVAACYRKPGTCDDVDRCLDDELVKARDDVERCTAGRRDIDAWTVPPPFRLIQRRRSPCDGAAVAVLIDRSSSIRDASLAATKRAAIAAVQTLGKQQDACVEVVAFDSSPAVVAPLQPVVAGTLAQIAAIKRSGAGAELFGALSAAQRDLPHVGTTRRHVVILSDGVFPTFKSVSELVTEMGAQGITVSTVAVDDNADVTLLRLLAAAGRGGYHGAPDPRPLADLVRDAIDDP